MSSQGVECSWPGFHGHKGECLLLLSCREGGSSRVYSNKVKNEPMERCCELPIMGNELLACDCDEEAFQYDGLLFLTDIA